LTQLRFERPEPELELGQKNNSPSKQLSKRDRNDWGIQGWIAAGATAMPLELLQISCWQFSATFP
jgi:hypothetical protein